MPVTPSIALCFPHRGKWDDVPEVIRKAVDCPSLSYDYFIATYKGSHPVPLMNFNQMWCQARLEKGWSGSGVTDLAMVHDDVFLAPGFLDILLRERNRVGADFISAVIPIADERGVTSTAKEDPERGEWNPRRYTMHEVGQKPTTWSEKGLLLNNGCMLMRFDKPCFRDLWWETRYRINHNAGGGKSRAEFISEDWNLSREVERAGGSLAATTAVQLFHRKPEYHNRYAWGTWITEQEG